MDNANLEDIMLFHIRGRELKGLIIKDLLNLKKVLVLSYI